MRALQPFKQRIIRLLTTPGEQLGRWARFLRFQIHLWRFCLRRLREHNALAMSSALSFRTIFALVPALVLALLVLNSFEVFGDRRQGLRQFMDWSGLAQISIKRESRAAATAPATAPASGPRDDRAMRLTLRRNRRADLAEGIERIVSAVERKFTLGRIGPVGAIVLIWTVLTLLTTMERSLNRIFGATRTRSPGRRLLLYWSVVTLGPVFLAGAIYVAQMAAEALQDVAVLSHLLAAAAWAGPVVTGAVLLAMLYKLMPNTRVSFRAAMGGAIIAIPLWLLAKWGFSLYVRYLVGARSLYGALGLAPLFLFWVNTSWLIFLFGAELAHTAVNLSVIQAADQADKTMLEPADLLAAAIAVARPFASGQGPAGLRQVASQLKLPEESVSRLLDRLVAGGVLCPVAGGADDAFVPARPIETIPVAEALGVGASGGSIRPSRNYDDQIARAVDRARQQTADSMKGRTLAELII